MPGLQQIHRSARVTPSVIVASAFIAVAPLSLSLAAASSTEPLRSTDANAATSNPPQATSPIYYPILASAEVSDDAAAGQTPESLLREFMLRHTAMDYPGAAEAALRLIHAAPDFPDGYYNYACALSRMQRLDEAFTALEKAIELGWRDVRHMNMDPDLKNMRSRSEAFAALIRQINDAIENETIPSTPPRTDLWPEVVSDIEQHVPALMKRYHIPGMSVALVNDGQIVWRSAYGIADRRTSEPLSESDRFRVHAPLHLLVLIAAAQQSRSDLPGLLAQAGQLHSQALAHARQEGDRSGSRRHRSDREAVPVGIRSSSHSRKQTQQAMTAASDSLELLILAVETSSGESFAQTCTRSLLAPLQMNASAIYPIRSAAASDVIGHSRLGSPMAIDTAPEHITGLELLTTANDLARLLAAMLPPRSDTAAHASPKAGALASANPDATSDSIAAASAEALQALRQVQQNLTHPLPISIAFPQQPQDSRVQVADVHIGSGCLMRWHPDQRRGIVILFNSATGMPAAERLASIALGGE